MVQFWRQSIAEVAGVECRGESPLGANDKAGTKKRKSEAAAAAAQ